MKRLLSLCVLTAFVINSFGVIPVHADMALPTPGTMVNLSPAFEPALIKGLTINKDNPFVFDFIVDAGDDNIQGDELKQQSDRMIKYFFSALSVPEKDTWVNLSPYEKDRIVPDALGQTTMGRDLLAQDYILKQLTASLLYPEKELGKKFWDKIYAKARETYGADVNIPVNTFNKVWIVAEKAHVYEHGQTAWVVDGHLKVMLEEDYLALSRNSHTLTGPVTAPPYKSSELGKLAPPVYREPVAVPPVNVTKTLSTQVIRDLIIPEIENEVNSGKNFAQLRQIFNSLILATWFKKNLKESIINKAITDKNIVNGLVADAQSLSTETIYQQYLQAYKKGVFNLIKEEQNPITKETLPRKYFSGGFDVSRAMVSSATLDGAKESLKQAHQLSRVRTGLMNPAMTAAEPISIQKTLTQTNGGLLTNSFKGRGILVVIDAVLSGLQRKRSDVSTIDGQVRSGQDHVIRFDATDLNNYQFILSTKGLTITFKDGNIINIWSRFAPLPPTMSITGRNFTSEQIEAVFASIMNQFGLTLSKKDRQTPTPPANAAMVSPAMRKKANLESVRKALTKSSSGQFAFGDRKFSTLKKLEHLDAFLEIMAFDLDNEVEEEGLIINNLMSEPSSRQHIITIQSADMEEREWMSFLDLFRQQYSPLMNWLKFTLVKTPQHQTLLVSLRQQPKVGAILRRPSIKADLDRVLKQIEKDSISLGKLIEAKNDAAMQTLEDAIDDVVSVYESLKQEEEFRRANARTLDSFLSRMFEGLLRELTEYEQGQDVTAVRRSYLLLNDAVTALLAESPQDRNALDAAAYNQDSMTQRRVAIFNQEFMGDFFISAALRTKLAPLKIALDACGKLFEYTDLPPQGVNESRAMTVEDAIMHTTRELGSVGFTDEIPEIRDAKSIEHVAVAVRRLGIVLSQLPDTIDIGEKEGVIRGLLTHLADRATTVPSQRVVVTRAYRKVDMVVKRISESLRGAGILIFPTLVLSGLNKERRDVLNMQVGLKNNNLLPIRFGATDLGIYEFNLVKRGLTIKFQDQEITLKYGRARNLPVFTIEAQGFTREDVDNVFAELEKGFGLEERSAPDRALTSPTGGIDLNTADMGMTIETDAQGGVQVTVDPAMIEQIKREGFKSINPVIINITPIHDIRPFLGLSPA